MLNRLRAQRLLIRAGGLLGGRRYDDAIALGLRADALTPDDDSVLTVLFSAYRASERWGEADAVIERALANWPNDASWNQSMVESLVRRRAPAETMLPYLRTYVRTTRSHRVERRLPWWFRAMAVLAQPIFRLRGGRGSISERIESYMSQIGQHEDEWLEWALETLRRRGGRDRQFAEMIRLDRP